MLSSLPVWAAIPAFAAAALIVWIAGAKVTLLLDPLARRYRLGEAFVGMLLLGGVTSLPEIATVATAASTGEAPLAVNNVLGSVALNVLFLALADLMLCRSALTSTVGSPATLLQGVLSMLLLGIVCLAVLTGEVSILGVGAWSFALLAGSITAFRLAATYAERAPWTVKEEVRCAGGDEAGKGEEEEGEPRLLIPKILGCAAVILAAGFVLATAGDAIARASGLGSGLVGLVLVAFATSLPELSSIRTGLRRGRNELVIGDIFGTNVFNMLLIVLADALYREGPVLAEMGRFEVVAALLGMLLTGVFLVGLLERRDRTVLRMGYDAALAFLLYAGGLALLWPLQGEGGAG